ncbi:HAD hydrolase-like protein [Sporosarcina sp. FSL K6-2383]|uniref:HAD hydrolase-like protein n=1 Tax=Sporosarcina sp. FSL K6-2383 TaxID=2921556 RepID=UPI00315A1C2F
MSYTMIFDMDGTLFQTDKILEISLEKTFHYLRASGLWDKQAPVEEYREIMGVPLQVVWETLLPNQTNDIRAKVNAIFLEKLIENIRTGKGALYPNVEQVLDYLTTKNYSLFIASNGLPEYLAAIVDYYKLDRWIKETFSIQQIESQNKSDLVRTIVDKYAVEQGAVVGDRLSDIQAAKDNGLLAIGCHFDFAQEDELAQADEVIDDLAQLKDLVAVRRSSIT